MKSKLIKSLLVLSIAGASVCLAGTPSADDGSVDLSRYKTFGWDPSQKNLMTENPRSISATTKRAIIAQMSTRGYRLDVNSPQLIVRLNAEVRNPALAVSATGVPQAGADAPAVVISDLVLSMTDAKTGELVWSNTADVRISNEQAKIPAKAFQDAIGDLYAGYPGAQGNRSQFAVGYVSLPPPPEQNNEIKFYDTSK